MALSQLIYISRPFGFDEATLNAILFSARHHNKINEITGALICREDIFLQMLEGPDEALTATYSRIKRDERHINVELLWTDRSDARQFPEWGMRHDPAQSWLWTPDEVWAGAAQKAPAAEIRTIFARIAGEPYDQSLAVL